MATVSIGFMGAVTVDNTYDVRLVTSKTELDSLKDAYESLRNQTPGITFFQSYEWVRTWHECFTPENSPVVAVAKRGEDILAALPLEVQSSKSARGASRTFVSVSGTSNYQSDYAEILHHPSFVASLPSFLGKVVSLLSPAHFRFFNLREDSALCLALQELERPYRSSEFLYDAPFWSFGQDMEDKKLLNKKSLKRHLNYFKRSGAVQLAAADESDFELFFEQHKARRELAGDKSDFLHAPYRDFYRKLFERLSSSSCLFQKVLHDSKVLAYHFGFRDRDRFFWYKPTFDVSLLKKSPGEVLIKLLLEQSVASEDSAFDFTVGSEPFKYRFSNQVTRVVQIELFCGARSYLQSQLYKALRTFYHRARKALSSPPSFFTPSKYSQ